MNYERVQRRADGCFHFIVMENGAVVIASFPGVLDNRLDETTCTELPVSETLKTVTRRVLATRQMTSKTAAIERKEDRDQRQPISS